MLHGHVIKTVQLLIAELTDKGLEIMEQKTQLLEKLWEEKNNNVFWNISCHKLEYKKH